MVAGGDRRTDNLTRVEARAQLALLLANARDEKLAGFTVDGLAGMYRVARADIATMLAQAQQRRLPHA